MNILFEDNFLYDGKPKENDYTFETGGFGWGNRELQYYTDRIDNCFIKDGILYIKAQREEYNNNHFTSAKLSTYKKHSFLYGSFRIMAKLPRSFGLWPAIWLLPNSFKDGEKWPDCGEIDILESVGSEPYRLHFSLHSKDNNFHFKNQINKVIVNKDIYDRFIEYRLDWTKEGFRFFLDGEEVAYFEKSENTNNSNWPFDKEQYLIINLAVGGSWPTAPKNDFISDMLEIKYIRVYEI